jgi:hypothetical protein
MVQRRIEELRDVLAFRAVVQAARRRPLRLEHERQAIEELAHPRRERAREFVERGRHVALKGGGGQALDEGPAEIEGAQLPKREAGRVEAAEGFLFVVAVPLAVELVVEKRETGRLQRFEITPDRPRGDAGPLCEVIDRRPACALEFAKDRPLADDLGVARHAPV